MTTQKSHRPDTGGINLQRAGAGGRRFRSFLPMALVAGAAMALGPAGTFRAEAYDVFPSSPSATASPTFACFQIAVTLSPALQAALLTGYPGWDGSTYLTSPGLADPNTIINESMGLPAVPVDGGSPPADNFPNVTIGGGPPIGSPLVTILPDTPANFVYDALLYPYPFWTTHNGPNSISGPWTTMLTEVQQFDLSSINSASGVQCPPGQNSLLGPGFTGNPLEVKAGFGYLADPARRSLGMIRTLDNSTFQNANWPTFYLPNVYGPDFPAKSFFNVYVEITLPVVGGTASATSFPSAGAVLYNDVTEPLIVDSEDLTSLPGGSNSLFYTHSPATLPVTLRFRDNNPPYWGAGDIFGSVTLAGHGIFQPCAKGFNWDSFIADVMGTEGHAQPAAAVAGMYPTSNYPWTNCIYHTAYGMNFSGQPWDALTFASETTVSAAYLTLTNFQFPIALPAFGSSATYTNTNTLATLSWSLNGLTNYIQSMATGTVQVLIMNTNGTTNGITTYNTQLQQMNLKGSSTVIGNYELRVTTNKVAAGLHFVNTHGPGYRIASYFDVSIDISQNNGVNWTTDDEPVRLTMGNPPCGADIEPLHVWRSGTNVVVNWADPSYTLQYSTIVNPSVWTTLPGTPPITNSAAGPTRFYRLICSGE